MATSFGARFKPHSLMLGLGGAMMIAGVCTLFASEFVAVRGIAVRDGTPVRIRGTEGEIATLSFKLRNNDPVRTARVMGSEAFCIPWGCLKLQGMPMEIPPRCTRSVHVKWTSTRPGTFTRRFKLYSNVPGQGEIPLTLRSSADRAGTGTLAVTAE